MRARVVMPMAVSTGIILYFLSFYSLLCVSANFLFIYDAFVYVILQAFFPNSQSRNERVGYSLDVRFVF